MSEEIVITPSSLFFIFFKSDFLKKKKKKKYKIFIHILYIYIFFFFSV